MRIGKKKEHKIAHCALKCSVRPILRAPNIRNIMVLTLYMRYGLYFRVLSSPWIYSSKVAHLLGGYRFNANKHAAYRWPYFRLATCNETTWGCNITARLFVQITLGLLCWQWLPTIRSRIKPHYIYWRRRLTSNRTTCIAFVNMLFVVFFCACVTLKMICVICVTAAKRNSATRMNCNRRIYMFLPRIVMVYVSFRTWWLCFWSFSNVTVHMRVMGYIIIVGCSYTYSAVEEGGSCI